MNELYERIARAMAEAFEQNSPDDWCSLSKDASYLSIDGKFNTVPVIRAVLLAIRKPTEVMIVASCGPRWASSDIEDRWERMIDAALATEPAA